MTQQWFRKFEQVQHEIDGWRAHYNNHIQPHSSLNYMALVAYTVKLALYDFLYFTVAFSRGKSQEK